MTPREQWDENYGRAWLEGAVFSARHSVWMARNVDRVNEEPWYWDGPHDADEQWQQAVFHLLHALLSAKPMHRERR